MGRLVLRVLLAPALVASVLAGCGGEDRSDEPALSKPKAGQCVAKEMEDGPNQVPDFTTVVPCTEPHIREVVAVIDVPEKFLDSSSPEAALARRTELSSDTANPTQLAKEFFVQLTPQCLRAVSRAAGLAPTKSEIKVEATDDPDAAVSAIQNMVLLPSSPSSAHPSLTPPELWKKGMTQYVCSIRYVDPHDVEKPKAVTSATSKQVIRSYLTPDFPADQRWCGVSSDTGSIEVVSCTASDHEVEYLWDVGDPAAAAEFTLDEPGIDLCLNVLRTLDFEHNTGFSMTVLRDKSDSKSCGASLASAPDGNHMKAGWAVW